MVAPPPQIRSSDLQPLPPSLQPPPPPLPPSQNLSPSPAATLPRPHTELQRISGRTRSKTAQFSNAPTIDPSVTPEESISSSPTLSDQGLHHSVGLLSMSKTALLSMMTTRRTVDAGRRNKSPIFGAAGGRNFPLETAKGYHRLPAPGGPRVLWRRCSPLERTLPSTWATSGRHTKPPDFPHRFASDLKVPRSHKKAMRSEHAHLWKYSAGREFYGLLDAGTFAPV